MKCQHQHKHMECDCHSVCIRVSKAHEMKSKCCQAEKFKKYFFDDTPSYILKPQGIEISSPNVLAVFSLIDSCYELVCTKCHSSFRIITCRQSALIQRINMTPNIKRMLHNNTSILSTTFPFQLRPFIKILLSSQSMPKLLNNEEVIEECEEEDNYIHSADCIKSYLPIVGDIPSGFLVL